MKTKLIFLITTCCFAFTTQAQKPFKELGLDHEVNYITLSDGRYIEYVENDTLRQIGSVMFNTQTNKVAYIIPEDELEKIKIARRDKEVSRFMSVDPLTGKYPWYTPYSFSGNKVIAWAELEGKEEVLVIREQVNASEYRLMYIWDVTAEEREEQGQIQYYNVSTGTLGVMRGTTLEERKNQAILNYLRVALTPDTRTSTVNSYVTEQMGLQRIAEDGSLVPYLQTHRNASGANVGEAFKIFIDDVLLSGITSTIYTMPEFRSATNAQKTNMTQPSASMRADLDALATNYLSGNAIDIKVQITTNNPSTMVNIIESNSMRQNAIVDYLVSQGVNRSSIQTLPFLYNQSTWDAQITYDEAKPSTP